MFALQAFGVLPFTLASFPQPAQLTETKRRPETKLVSNHFIDLKHAHMAVCFFPFFFFKKKKAVSLFCGKVQKEC